MNDELLFEPDYTNPNAPYLTAEQRDMYKHNTFAFVQASMILSAPEKQFPIREGMARIILKEVSYV